MAALLGEGARAHAEDQYVAAFCQSRGCQRVVKVHTGQRAVLDALRLDAEHHAG